jgi:2-polyprenyl-3-methyl-5-hydroxy-6-metoxy-1,4-benzoquinol methylase
MYSILASESKEKVLNYLARNPYKTAKEISEGSGINYKHTFKILKEFEEKDIVLVKNKSYYLKSDFIHHIKRLSDTLMRNYSKEFFFKNKYDLYNMLSSTYKDDDVKKKIEKIMDSWIMEKLDDWYSKFYDPQNTEYNLLRDTIKSLPKKDKILELGCGTGRLTFKLAKDFKKIVAVDESKENIEFCKKNNKAKNIEFENKTAKDLKSKEKYDVIIFSWMGLHYHPDYKEIIENIRSMMHAKSSIIIIDAYTETEYIKILQIVRERDMSASNKAKEELNNFLVEQFKNFEQKVVFTEYHFPSIEELINNFKIELTLEESYIWTKEDEEKIRKYLDTKENPLLVQEGLTFTIIRP